jgi:tol-pal system protein YbgF
VIRPKSHAGGGTRRLDPFRFLPLSLLVTGCMLFTTRKEGAKLSADVDAVRREAAEQRRALEVRLAAAEAEVAKVRETLGEGTQLLARNSADADAQVQRIQATVEALTVRLEESLREIEALRKELADARAQAAAKTGEPAPPAGAPQSKQDLFAEGERRLKAKEYEEARRLLRQFVGRHGDDALADDARYLIGETYFSEARYGAAIGEYQKVIDGYPKGDKADDAFLRNGVAFFRLKSCAEARVFLEEMLRRFPKSTLVPKARQTIDDVDKARKNKAKCN